jgi:hypothetical protein
MYGLSRRDRLRTDPFQLLQEAIAVLDEAESKKDPREEIQRTIGLLDRLTDADRDAAPIGSIRRITRARHALNFPSRDPHLIYSEIACAKRTLKHLLRDWETFPRASWW